MYVVRGVLDSVASRVNVREFNVGVGYKIPLCVAVSKPHLGEGGKNLLTLRFDSILG